MSRLTSAEITAMPAGPEMDALVAEKVFGLHVEWRNGRPWWIGGDELPGSPYRMEDGRYGHPIQSYSTDKSAFLEILEKLETLGFRWQLAKYNKCGYLFEVFQPGSFFESIDLKMPTSICRGALKAVRT